MFNTEAIANANVIAIAPQKTPIELIQMIEFDLSLLL